MGLQGKTNEEKIWNFLKERGLTDYGAAGLMGNLYAESGFKSTNLQNTYEKKLGFTDDTYTDAVDKGYYNNFVKDCAGYGLAQWTHWSRKQKLLEYAKSKGASIGDLEMQLEFLIRELEQSFTTVIATLRKAIAMREASDVVLLKFERPADQSETAKVRRANYGQKYYDKFAGTVGGQLQLPDLEIPAIGIEGNKDASYITYVVKRGDTLDKIARLHGMNYKELAEYNSISNPNLIEVGQVIKIPQKWVPKVGDVVIFNGEAQYYSANSIFGKPCMSGRARIVEIKPLTKHPYHLIYILGGGSNVNKWVDEGTFTKA